MLTPVLITLSAIVVGGYMLLDGVRELTGRGYMGLPSGWWTGALASRGCAMGLKGHLLAR